MRAGRTFNASVGVPATWTTPVNSTANVNDCPARYAPSGAGDVTRATVVATPVLIGSVNAAAVRLRLPAGSAKAFAATVIVAAVAAPGAGVKMPEYTAPDPVNPASVPSVTVISPATKLATFSVTVNVSTAVSAAASELRSLVMRRVGGAKSATRATPTLAAESLPAASRKTTVSRPPCGTAAWRASGVSVPRSKVTAVSAEPIATSLARTVVPRRSRAEPPVATPGAIVAVAVRLVFVRLRVCATTVPPTGVTVGAPGAAGACVAITKAFAPPRLSAPAGSVVVASALPAGSRTVPVV